MYRIRFFTRSSLLPLAVSFLLVIGTSAASAGVNVYVDAAKDLVNIGDVEPSAAISPVIWNNCNDHGCSFAHSSFNTDIFFASHPCGVSSNQNSCTINIDGELPGWDMRNMFADALSQTLKRVEQTSSVSSLTEETDCDDKHRCSHFCVPPKMSAINWPIPAQQRIMGWDTGNNFKGHIQYTISCVGVPPKPLCPAWLGTATAGLLILQIPVVQIVGNLVNFTCLDFQSAAAQNKGVDNNAVRSEWDRNAPLATMPENCQDGGWHNANKDIWLAQYRNCPTPDLK